MNRLLNLLEHLESVVGKLDQSVTLTATQGGIIACADAIDKVRVKLGYNSTAGGSKVRAGFQRLEKRLAAPFQESDIVYWKDVVTSTQQSLQIALQALQM